jgi:uncharacterized protein (TIGR02246 family)
MSESTFFAAVGLVLLTSCSSSYDKAKAEAEIRDIEHAWAQVAVSGDPSVIEKIFADDFVGVAPDGQEYTKQGFIEDTKAHPLGFTSINLDEMTVRLNGNMAVAQGRETFTRKDGSRGRFVWTDVFERRDGRWQIIAAEDVLAPAEGQPASAALFTVGTDLAQARQAIDKTRNAYVAAWRAANPEQIAELYTDDAYVLYPNQPAVEGKLAIRDYFRNFFRDFPKNEFELASAEIVVTGPWAFDRGTYRWKGTPRAGGKAIEDNGKYLVVLQQQGDGTWKVARDMDNSDLAGTQSTRAAQ